MVGHLAPILMQIGRGTSIPEQIHDGLVVQVPHHAHREAVRTFVWGLALGRARLGAASGAVSGRNRRAMRE